MTNSAPRQPDPGNSAPPLGTDNETGKVPARDSRLDNAKILLVGLVLIVHPLVALRYYGLTNAIYCGIYFFHMPAFTLISGYLSRSFDASSKRTEKPVLSLATLYLFFWTLRQAIYTVERGDLPD